MDPSDAQWRNRPAGNRTDQRAPSRDPVGDLTGRERCKREDQADLPFRRQVHTVLGRACSVEEKIRSLLQVSVDWFGLEAGFLSQVDPVEQMYRTVVNTGPQAVKEGWTNAPAHQTYGLGGHIGTRIMVKGQLYGTICLGNRDMEIGPLNGEERAVLELVAQSMERVIEQGRRQKETDQIRSKYKLLLEAAPDAIVLVDVDTGRIVEANQKAAELLEAPAEQIVGRHQTDLHPDEDADRYRRLFRECCQPGRERTVRRFEDENPSHPDSSIYVETDAGESVPVEISAATVELTGQTLTVGIFRNITEQQERNLRHRSSAMEAATDGIAILDSDATYQYANQAHADVYGYDTPEALLNRSWTICYDDEEQRRLEADAMPSLRETGEWRGEARGQRADGSTFPQELSLTVLEDGSIICVVRDITDRKQAEEELRSTKNFYSIEMSAREGI